MDIFRTAIGGNSNAAQPPVNPALQQTQPGNLPATATPAMTAASADGQTPGLANNPKEIPSPFAEFEKLWDTPTLPEGQTADAPIQFNIDPAKVNQSARGIDFTKTITPALLEKINAGGEGATQAMLQAMNEMGQSVFAQAMMANTKILEKGLESGHQRVQKTLPDAVRKQAIGQALREDNPLFTNPATAPMLEMLETQLTAQFPGATAAQIKDHARKYLTSFADEAAKLKPAPAQSKGTSRAVRETDWSEMPVD